MNTVKKNLMFAMLAVAGLCASRNINAMGRQILLTLQEGVGLKLTPRAAERLAASLREKGSQGLVKVIAQTIAEKKGLAVQPTRIAQAWYDLGKAAEQSAKQAAEQAHTYAQLKNAHKVVRWAATHPYDAKVAAGVVGGIAGGFGLESYVRYKNLESAQHDIQELKKDLELAQADRERYADACDLDRQLQDELAEIAAEYELKLKHEAAVTSLQKRMAEQLAACAEVKEIPAVQVVDTVVTEKQQPELVVAEAEVVVPSVVEKKETPWYASAVNMVAAHKSGIAAGSLAIAFPVALKYLVGK